MKQSGEENEESDRGYQKEIISAVYLFYGEEEYLKQQYKQKMKEVLLPEGDTMNLTVYEGKSADPQEIMAQAETMPFFADYRLILVENSGFFKSGGGDLAEYVSRIPQETVLVFIEKEVDKRSRLYKAVKSGGTHCGISKTGRENPYPVDPAQYEAGEETDHGKRHAAFFIYGRK